MIYSTVIILIQNFYAAILMQVQMAGCQAIIHYNRLLGYKPGLIYNLIPLIPIFKRYLVLCQIKINTSSSSDIR